MNDLGTDLLIRGMEITWDIWALDTDFEILMQKTVEEQLNNVFCRREYEQWTFLGIVTKFNQEKLHLTVL